MSIQDIAPYILSFCRDSGTIKLSSLYGDEFSIPFSLLPKNIQRSLDQITARDVVEAVRYLTDCIRKVRHDAGHARQALVAAKLRSKSYELAYLCVSGDCPGVDGKRCPLGLSATQCHDVTPDHWTAILKANRKQGG